MLGANGCQALLVAETLTPHPPDCFVHGDQLFQQRRLLLSARQTHVLANVSCVPAPRDPVLKRGPAAANRTPPRGKEDSACGSGDETPFAVNSKLFCLQPKMQDKTVLEVCVFATNLLGFCVDALTKTPGLASQSMGGYC